MRCSLRLYLFLILAAGLALARESRIAPLDAWQLRFASWLNANAPRPELPAPLVAVQITDEDLQETPLPWSPLEYALFLNAALPFRPSAVGIEPLLAWQTEDSQQVGMLHNQLLEAPKILLGAELGLANASSTWPEAQEIPALGEVRGETGALPEFTLISKQPAEEIRLAGTLGFENLPEENGAPLRSMPLLFRYRGQVVPSFALQAAMLWLGVTPEEVKAALGSHIDLGKKLRIPIDARGAMLVNWSVPVTHFSVGDLLLSAEQTQRGNKTVAPVAQLNGSFALLVREDTEARTLHLATGRRKTRGDAMTAAIATIQSGAFLQSPPRWAGALLVFEGLILGCFCSRMGKWNSAAACIMAISCYMLVALGVFSATLVALPLVLPAGLIAFIFAVRMLD